ncbi:MAG: methionyl-tRNA formyltransferase [Deltaproteobacteria bacterium]|nr:MAG: methionyl-tRNA formyltransferase [Deltaproteobacteria bacterium]
MRIVLIGQAAFGEKVIERLLERGEDIVAVYTPPDRPGGRPDPLKEAAIAKNIPVLQPATYKDDSVFLEYQNLNPDLTILAFVTDIIPERFFRLPTAGAICYHPSLLPLHRGSSAINWAVIKGRAKTGLTIFWPDGGIDTGPMLLQQEVDIGPDDTTGSLYFNHLFPMGVDAIVEAVDLIKQGKAPKIPQPEEGATYEPPCDDRVAAIDWEKPGQSVYDLVRGCDPQPGAYSYWQGEKIRFYSAQLSLEPTEEAPGTVVQADAQGFQVAVKDGRLTVGKVRPQPGGKINAAAFVSERDLKVGDRFGEET